MESEITQDCTCEQKAPNTKRRKLMKGDKIILMKEWANEFGSYFRISVGGSEEDIEAKNVKRK